MQGLFKTAPGEGNMELRSVPEPKPGPGEVLIEVKAAGICGSDLHIYHWDINFKLKPPVVIGHEYAGEIVEIGPDVEGWSVGDRVTAEPSAIVCGTCRYCRTGSYNLCPERRVQGYWVNGAFAEYTVMPAHRLHRLPANVDFRTGSLVEPLACCVHGVLELTGVSANDFVVVTGPGAIGLLCAQLAKAEGGRVMVIGTSADSHRLQKAMELGADYVLDLQAEDAVQRIRELTEGYGADVVLECSGAPAAADLGLDLVRKQGKFTQMGLYGKPITVDFEKIAYKELKVTGSMAQRWTAWRWSLQLLEQEKVDVLSLVSDVFPLSEWKAAFDRFENKGGLKIGFDPKR